MQNYIDVDTPPLARGQAGEELLILAAVDQVVVIGSVEVSGAALRALLQNRCTVAVRTQVKHHRQAGSATCGGEVTKDLYRPQSSPST